MSNKTHNGGTYIKQRIKRTLIVGGTVLSVGAASLGTMGLAHAATSSSTTNPQQSLIEKLASKFNLNKDDVQKVFNEDRATREAEQEERVQTELAQLVTDGKITQEQADKITAKAKELQSERQANRDAMKDKTQEERKTAMEAKRTELEKWLSDNGIDKEYGRFLMGGRGHGGPGGPPPADQQSSDSTN